MISGVFSPFRKSLFLKVFSLSATISIAAIYLLGAQLHDRVTERIIEEKIRSSVVEGRSAIQYVEYRFRIRTKGEESDLKALAEEVIKSANVSAQTSGREIILINTEGKRVDGLPARISSNFLDISSIPNQLRIEVQNDSELKWQEGKLSYVNGKQMPGVFVGRIIEIPKIGQYEIYAAYDFSGEERTFSLLGRALWGTGIALIALILITASLVLRLAIAPVRAAATVAEKLSSGELEQRMEVRGEDEVARLAIAFNEMASSMSSQISRLENLSRLQRRFVSDVSHELRTPLTTIRMASDVIHSARDSFDPAIARSAELLLSQIERFEALLADLLEVSRFDAQVAALNLEKVDLGRLLDQILSDFSSIAKERNSQVLLKMPEHLLTIDGDRRRIERILRNLIVNAIEHSQSQPIELTVKQNLTATSISVRDFGEGIDRQYLSRVFDRFWRADESRSRFRGGTGLGLAIAKEDALLHGGDIRLWSERGLGAHFVLTLPLAQESEIDDFPISEIPTDAK
jgi:two-component system sensor histidine kinase MtrB